MGLLQFSTWATLAIGAMFLTLLAPPASGDQEKAPAKPSSSPSKDDAKTNDAKSNTKKRDAKKNDEAHRDPAGRADVLRMLPKKFARFVSADAAKLQVTLHAEGEAAAKTWLVMADAEIKRHGWWARLEQFTPGDRVWVWLDIDRKKQPTAVLMLCDEISEQDIHGQPLKLEAVDVAARALTLKTAKGDRRVLKLASNISLDQAADEYEFLITPRGTDRGASAEAIEVRAELGDSLYVQTAGDTVVELLDDDGFEALRRRQDQWLRERWRQDGLAGTVTFLHRLGGEMEVMLDHEAIRWGRYLKSGDEITLIAASRDTASGGSADKAEPIRGAVKHVAPWRERTNVRLVVSGLDQTLLSIGQRIQAKLPEPPAAVQDSELPTDIGRSRSKAERIDWFLNSVYCVCPIGGDGCTGMFYTLASCSAHNCGMPKRMRSDVEKLINKGLTDEQIYAELRKTHGRLLGRPHLLP